MKISKIFLMTVVVAILGSCSSNILQIENSLPNSKLVLEKDPDQKSFYAANYETVSQNIYSDKVKVYILSEGENKFTLDTSVESYAAYFMLPKISQDKKTQTWKYLLDSSSGGDFVISGGGEIQKN